MAETLGVRPHAVELDGPFPWPLLLDPITASLRFLPLLVSVVGSPLHLTVTGACTARHWVKVLDL